MCAAAAVLPIDADSREGAVKLVPHLLDKIRDRVLDGYAAAPHGGVELGFILVGRHSENGVVVEHFREIPCTHLLSPRFLLSPDEERQVPEWLEALKKDPELEGTEPVGWGCSHHRSDLTLLDREMAFHQRLFSRWSKVVMVVKPQDMQTVVAGLFLPDESGAIPDGSPAVQLRSSLLHATHGRELAPVAQRTPKLAEVLELREDVGRSDAEHEAPGEPQKRFRLPSRPIGIAIGVAAAALILAVVLAARLLPGSNPAAVPSLSVGIRSQAGDLMFTWTSNIRHVQSAQIDVLDGTARSHFDVTAGYQPAGVFVFPHASGTVQAVLTLQTEHGKVARSIRFIDGRKHLDAYRKSQP